MARVKGGDIDWERHRERFYLAPANVTLKEYCEDNGLNLTTAYNRIKANGKAEYRKQMLKNVETGMQRASLEHGYELGTMIIHHIQMDSDLAMRLSKEFELQLDKRSDDLTIRELRDLVNIFMNLTSAKSKIFSYGDGKLDTAPKVNIDSDVVVING